MPNPHFHPTLDTPRLQLRPLTLEDAPALLRIFSDPEVMRYWNTPPWPDLATAQDFIRSSLEAMQREESLTLAIVERASGALVGKCLLFQYLPSSRRAEIGFGLGRDSWGKGYVAEAGQALIAHGATALGLRRIEAEIDPDNTGSARALVRLGFEQEGLLRQRWEIAGVVSDSALYGLLLDGKAQALAQA